MEANKTNAKGTILRRFTICVKRDNSLHLHEIVQILVLVDVFCALRSCLEDTIVNTRKIDQA